MGAVILMALLAAATWTMLDLRRLQYQTATAWLRFVLRLTLMFLMTYYALVKVFPLQMLVPSLAVLNEPVGLTSPLTLLWTLIGLHPGYEMICGAIEELCAVLLFFCRTALLGALLTSFVMTNVLLYNVLFDVPVKLRAAYMLLFRLRSSHRTFARSINFIGDISQHRHALLHCQSVSQGGQQRSLYCWQGQLVLEFVRFRIVLLNKTLLSAVNSNGCRH